MANIDTTQTQYNKALRYFLLTKYSHAATSCVKALDQLPTIENKDDSLDTLRFQLWLLYINVASTILSSTTTQSTLLTPRLAKQFGLPLTSVSSIEHFSLAIWERLVKDCGGAGHCDPRLVCAYSLLTLKQSIPIMGRQAAEQWFATLPDSIIDHLTLQDSEDDIYYTSYLQVVDLYAAQILPQCGDLESARSFVEYNSFLSDEKKENLLNLIQHVEDNQHRQAERKKQLERQQKEEAEAAAKQAALEKERQEQNARELQERKKKEAILQQQRQQQQQQQKQSEQTVSTSSSVPSATRSPTVSKQTPLSDKSLSVVKTWMQQLQATGSAASVGILVIFFAILGLLKGPRGYLTTALRTIMEKIWQTAKMGTKVTYM